MAQQLRALTALPKVLSVVIIKRKRDKGVCSTAVWGKGVHQWVHAKASLPPKGPDTQWYSIE